MKPMRCILLLCLGLFLPSAARSVETLRFEAVLYLFKSASFSGISFKDALLHGKPALSGKGIVISPPAIVRFDREELRLTGARYTWNGVSQVPLQFSETKLPAIIAFAGQTASIQAVVPVQYLEKMPDGRLEVRDIGGNLPELPHYRLTLSARPATEANTGYDLIVSCQMDISTMRGREKITGVDLDVGRPILARFEQKVEFGARKGEWFGLLADTDDSGDYGLWVMLRVSPGGEAARPATPQ